MMYALRIGQCDGCRKIRAGIETVYDAHYSFDQPPDYDEYELCPRCIAEAAVSDFAGEIEMFESHVEELEAGGSPEAEELRRDLELELYRFEQMARQVKARFEYLEAT